MYFNMFYCGGRLWDARPWFEMTKSDQGGIVIMEKKANILPVYVEKVYCGAANILKQELLSLGGELSIHKYAVNCKEEFSDVLILGTYKHYRFLYKKLALQHWKLKELGQELKITINNIMMSQRLTPERVSESNYQEIKSLALDFKPSGDILKDMAGLSLIERGHSKDKIIVLASGQFTDIIFMQEYILALQSKGYEVLLIGEQAEEKWIVTIFRPDYIYIV
ncbi:MAG: hypothetical protein VR72_20045 [Clostridiaceae bacterium BRH_c20a]|nr:MAG: hypothetical protein VR72_20045 [Clostridiaceae bacterium BRH_c20a]